MNEKICKRKCGKDLRHNSIYEPNGTYKWWVLVRKRKLSWNATNSQIKDVLRWFLQFRPTFLIDLFLFFEPHRLPTFYAYITSYCTLRCKASSNLRPQKRSPKRRYYINLSFWTISNVCHLNRGLGDSVNATTYFSSSQVFLNICKCKDVEEAVEYSKRSISIDNLTSYYYITDPFGPL